VIVDSTRKTIQIVTDHDTFTLPAESLEPLVSQVMARIRARAADVGASE
jgi:hypothetical protein